MKSFFFASSACPKNRRIRVLGYPYVQHVPRSVPLKMYPETVRTRGVSTGLHNRPLSQWYGCTRGTAALRLTVFKVFLFTVLPERSSTAFVFHVPYFVYACTVPDMFFFEKWTDSSMPSPESVLYTLGLAPRVSHGADGRELLHITQQPSLRKGTG